MQFVYEGQQKPVLETHSVGDLFMNTSISLIFIQVHLFLALNVIQLSQSVTVRLSWWDWSVTVGLVPVSAQLCNS